MSECRRVPARPFHRERSVQTAGSRLPNDGVAIRVPPVLCRRARTFSRRPISSSTAAISSSRVIFFSLILSGVTYPGNGYNVLTITKWRDLLQNNSLGPAMRKACRESLIIQLYSRILHSFCVCVNAVCRFCSPKYPCRFPRIAAWQLDAGELTGKLAAMRRCRNCAADDNPQPGRESVTRLLFASDPRVACASPVTR